MLVAALGVLAGLITTLSGVGGGMVLVTCLALLWDPLTALTVTSMALLIGNAQRLFLFREHFVWRYALPPALGAVPGALLGALIATTLSDLVLQTAIVAATLLAFAKLLMGPRLSVPPYLVVPGAAAVGFIAATTGGGGFLLAPIILSSGAQGGSYLAAGATTGVAIHIFRITGYASTGLIHPDLILTAALLALTIITGNLLGRHLRQRLPPPHPPLHRIQRPRRWRRPRRHRPPLRSPAPNRHL